MIVRTQYGRELYEYQNEIRTNSLDKYCIFLFFYFDKILEDVKISLARQSDFIFVTDNMRDSTYQLTFTNLIFDKESLFKQFYDNLSGDVKQKYKVIFIIPYTASSQLINNLFRKYPSYGILQFRKFDTKEFITRYLWRISK